MGRPVFRPKKGQQPSKKVATGQNSSTPKPQRAPLVRRVKSRFGRLRF